MKNQNLTVDEKFDRYFELQNKSYLTLTDSEKKELDQLISELSE